MQSFQLKELLFYLIFAVFFYPFSLKADTTYSTDFNQSIPFYLYSNSSSSSIESISSSLGCGHITGQHSYWLESPDCWQGVIQRAANSIVKFKFESLAWWLTIINDDNALNGALHIRWLYMTAALVLMATDWKTEKNLLIPLQTNSEALGRRLLIHYHRSATPGWVLTGLSTAPIPVTELKHLTAAESALLQLWQRMVVEKIDRLYLLRAGAGELLFIKEGDSIKYALPLIDEEKVSPPDLENWLWQCPWGESPPRNTLIAPEWISRFHHVLDCMDDNECRALKNDYDGRTYMSLAAPELLEGNGHEEGVIEETIEKTMTETIATSDLGGSYLIIQRSLTESPCISRLSISTSDNVDEDSLKTSTFSQWFVSPTLIEGLSPYVLEWSLETSASAIKAPLASSEGAVTPSLWEKSQMLFQSGLNFPFFTYSKPDSSPVITPDVPGIVNMPRGKNNRKSAFLPGTPASQSSTSTWKADAKPEEFYPDEKDYNDGESESDDESAGGRSNPTIDKNKGRKRKPVIDLGPSSKRQAVGELQMSFVSDTFEAFEFHPQSEAKSKSDIEYLLTEHTDDIWAADDSCSDYPILKVLLENNYVPLPVSGDGNCYFSALAEGALIQELIHNLPRHSVMTGADVRQRIYELYSVLERLFDSNLFKKLLEPSLSYSQNIGFSLSKILRPESQTLTEMVPEWAWGGDYLHSLAVSALNLQLYTLKYRSRKVFLNLESKEGILSTHILRQLPEEKVAQLNHYLTEKRPASQRQVRVLMLDRHYQPWISPAELAQLKLLKQFREHLSLSEQSIVDILLEGIDQSTAQAFNKLYNLEVRFRKKYPKANLENIQLIDSVQTSFTEASLEKGGLEKEGLEKGGLEKRSLEKRSLEERALEEESFEDIFDVEIMSPTDLLQYPVDLCQVNRDKKMLEQTVESNDEALTQLIEETNHLTEQYLTKQSSQLVQQHEELKIYEEKLQEQRETIENKEQQISLATEEAVKLKSLLLDESKKLKTVKQALNKTTQKQQQFEKRLIEIQIYNSKLQLERNQLHLHSTTIEHLAGTLVKEREVLKQHASKTATLINQLHTQGISLAVEMEQKIQKQQTEKSQWEKEKRALEEQVTQLDAEKEQLRSTQQAAVQPSTASAVNRKVVMVQLFDQKKEIQLWKKKLAEAKDETHRYQRMVKEKDDLSEQYQKENEKLTTAMTQLKDILSRNDALWLQDAKDMKAGKELILEKEKIIADGVCALKKKEADIRVLQEHIDHLQSELTTSKQELFARTLSWERTGEIWENNLKLEQDVLDLKEENARSALYLIALKSDTAKLTQEIRVSKEQQQEQAQSVDHFNSKLKEALEIIEQQAHQLESRSLEVHDNEQELNSLEDEILKLNEIVQLKEQKEKQLTASLQEAQTLTEENRRQIDSFVSYEKKWLQSELDSLQPLLRELETIEGEIRDASPGATPASQVLQVAIFELQGEVASICYSGECCQWFSRAYEIREKMNRVHREFQEARHQLLAHLDSSQKDLATAEPEQSGDSTSVVLMTEINEVNSNDPYPDIEPIGTAQINEPDTAERHESEMQSAQVLAMEQEIHRLKNQIVELKKQPDVTITNAQATVSSTRRDDAERIISANKNRKPKAITDLLIEADANVPELSELRHGLSWNTALTSYIARFILRFSQVKFEHAATTPYLAVFKSQSNMYWQTLEELLKRESIHSKQRLSSLLKHFRTEQVELPGFFRQTDDDGGSAAWHEGHIYFLIKYHFTENSRITSSYSPQRLTQAIAILQKLNPASATTHPAVDKAFRSELKVLFRKKSDMPDNEMAEWLAKQNISVPTYLIGQEIISSEWNAMTVGEVRSALGIPYIQFTADVEHNGGDEASYLPEPMNLVHLATLDPLSEEFRSQVLTLLSSVQEVNPAIIGKILTRFNDEGVMLPWYLEDFEQGWDEQRLFYFAVRAHLPAWNAYYKMQHKHGFLELLNPSSEEFDSELALILANTASDSDQTVSQILKPYVTVPDSVKGQRFDFTEWNHEAVREARQRHNIVAPRKGKITIGSLATMDVNSPEFKVAFKTFWEKIIVNKRTNTPSEPENTIWQKIARVTTLIKTQNKRYPQNALEVRSVRTPTSLDTPWTPVDVMVLLIHTQIYTEDQLTPLFTYKMLTTALVEETRCTDRYWYLFNHLKVLALSKEGSEKKAIQRITDLLLYRERQNPNKSVLPDGIIGTWGLATVSKIFVLLKERIFPASLNWISMKL